MPLDLDDLIFFYAFERGLINIWEAYKITAETQSLGPATMLDYGQFSVETRTLTVTQLEIWHRRDNWQVSELHLR